jgi:hypothetical protein
MHILNACQVAGAQYGAGIMRLEDVFKYNGDVTRSLLQNPVEECSPLLSDEFLKIIQQRFF